MHRGRLARNEVLDLVPVLAQAPYDLVRARPDKARLDLGDHHRGA